MKHVFSEKQFAVLLALSSAEKIYTFSISADMEDADLIEAIHFMYKAGYITEREGRFCLSPTLSSVAEAIRFCRHILKVEVPETDIPTRLAYCPGLTEDILVVERCISRFESSVKLQTIGIEDFIFDLIHSDLFSAGVWTVPSDPVTTERELPPEPADEGALGQMLFMLERMDVSTSAVEMTMKLYSSPLFYWIVLWDGKEKSCRQYSEELFRELLFQIIWRDNS